MNNRMEHLQCARSRAISKRPFLAACLLLLGAIILCSCSTRMTLPGGTFDLREGKDEYHGLWRITDVPGDRLGYYLLIKEANKSGVYRFSLTFYDDLGTCLLEAFEEQMDRVPVVFEGVIPSSTSSVRLRAVSTEATIDLALAGDRPLEASVIGLRNSEEIPLSLSVMTPSRQGSFDLRQCETGLSVWGSTLSLSASLTQQDHDFAESAELWAGYYSGFVQKLDGWRAEPGQTPDDEAPSISTTFQTDDLAYVWVNIISKEDFKLTFHVYATCPFTGP